MGAQHFISDSLPPAYSQFNTDSSNKIPSVQGQQPPLAGGNNERASSRRSATLFPAPLPLQHEEQSRVTDTGTQPPNPNRPLRERSSLEISLPGGFDVPSHQYAEASTNRPPIPQLTQNHDGPPDRSRSVYETGQVRGLGSAIDRGLRLAHKINPLGTRSEYVTS